MEIKDYFIEGVKEIILSPHIDNRGFFMRTFDIDFFNNHGLSYKWVQENHSMSKEKGVIRGLHFQLPSYTETKLIRCVKGKIMDVFVDLRKGSSSFGKWGSIILSEGKKNMALIPRGFAHGFCTLTEKSEVLYKVDNFYSPKHERGLYWADDTLNIRWPVNKPILSDKDKNNMSFIDFKSEIGGL